MGLRENWEQFSLLVLINAFVGGMVGLERTVVPLIGAEEFRIASTTIGVFFVASFGVGKALANLVSGHFPDRYGRKHMLVLGWLVGLPMPFMIAWPRGESDVGVIDSQSVRTTESGGPRGYDAGKKIKGRKRHIVTDTQGNLVGLVVHEASIQDRDGAPGVLASIRSLYPWLRHIFADGGYAGEKPAPGVEAHGRMDDRNYQALRHGAGLRSTTAQMGR